MRAVEVVRVEGTFVELRVGPVLFRFREVNGAVLEVVRVTDPGAGERVSDREYTEVLRRARAIIRDRRERVPRPVQLDLGIAGPITHPEEEHPYYRRWRP